jgi:dipeptidyl aminopeptidase/acylaminoacyl peptidase
MKAISLRLLVASAFFLSIDASLAAEKPKLTDVDVFELAYASDPIVSHNGDKVLYFQHNMDIMTDRSRRHLWIADVQSGDLRPITSGAMTASHAALAPDDNRIAFVSKDDSGNQIFMHWLDSGQTAQLTRVPEAPSRLSWSPNGRWLAFTMRVPEAPPTMGKLPAKPKGADWADPPVVVDRMIYRNDGRGNRKHGFTHVFVMPAAGGSPRQLTHGDFDHNSDIDWAADSSALFISSNRNADRDVDVVNSDIYRVEVADGAMTQLTDRKGPDNNPTVSPDGEQIAYLGWDDQKMGYHRTRLYVMDSDGSDRRELLAGLDRDIAQPAWSEDGKQIFFQYDDLGDTVLAVTDLQGEMVELVRGLGGKSLGRPYSGADIAVGGNNVYAYTSGSTARPADISVGQLGSEKQKQLTFLNENLLAHRDIAEVEAFWVKSSADGEDIQGWIAKPPGFDPKKQYPMILEIHGGPFTNYGFRFSTEVQLYAAAGYVVVYVNPRGSTSYGEDFGNLIHHAYPGQDYDDLMTAVDHVIAQGYIDNDQLYVTGGSGGGVLTAWIVGKTDRFRAAVVAKPVINWASFVLYADNPPYFSRYWFADMPWEDYESYWRRSPLSLVGNVSTPTMLLTGEADLRTPIAESEQYYQALKLRGVDTAMVRMPGAYHGIARRPSQLIGKVNAILEWFDRHSED